MFGNRSGVLLKVSFSDGIIGYGDCHPWHELGDLPLTVQLEKLKEEKLTSITTQSLNFARIDGEARKKKVHLFDGLTIPKSHKLVSDDSIPSDSSCLKFKDPKLLLSLLPKIGRDKKIRFDPNATFTLSQCREFLEKIQPWKELFDFIEDPMPFNQEQWALLEKNYQIPFALDRNEAKQTYSTMVIKSAVESYSGNCNRAVVTSYLGHPLEQLAAAYVAAHICPNEVCGLLSHLVYQQNEWSDQLAIQEERLIPPEGTGFGFDQLLENQKWEVLVND